MTLRNRTCGPGFPADPSAPAKPKSPYVLIRISYILKMNYSSKKCLIHNCDKIYSNLLLFKIAFNYENIKGNKEGRKERKKERREEWREEGRKEGRTVRKAIYLFTLNSTFTKTTDTTRSALKKLVTKN